MRFTSVGAPISLASVRRAWELGLLVSPRDARAGCIRFDEGHRTSKGYFGNLVRNSVWLVAVVLLLILLVVNARYMTDPTLDWETLRFSNKRLGIYSLSLAGGENGVYATVQLASTPALDSYRMERQPRLCVLGAPRPLLHVHGPVALEVRHQHQHRCSRELQGMAWVGRFSCLPIGTSRYQATSINPWASTAVAAVALAFAWGFTSPNWALPYAVNALEVALLASL